jgi:DNA-binding NtrC family response regulator
MQYRDESRPNETVTDSGSGKNNVGRAFLVMYHESDSQVWQLRPDVSFVVGRDQAADGRISEPSISRHHARFVLRDAAVLVEDLGSRNGVVLDGQRVEQALLRSGQSVALGKVTVWFQCQADDAHAQGALERYEDLRKRTELELSRARDERYCLCVVIVRAAESPRDAQNRFWLRIHARLGPADAITAYSPDAVLVTLPAKSLAEARRRVAQLTSADDPFVCGAAEFPRCGQSFESLVAEAHTAALRATRRQPLVFAEGPAAPASEQRNVVARSEALRNVLLQADRLAAIDVPVLVGGESGTGKELLAQRLHHAGPRARGPLCAVNCAALPSTLIESTLFGHVRGAFTGADRDAQGLFVQASGGTLLLDEVADLSASAQATLLRVIETKLVRPLGARKEIPVDVRVVSATNADLEAMVEDGRFRRDLLYRIAAVTLHVPPLRERPEDIEPLAELFVEEACARWNRPRPQLTASLRGALVGYAWPGNARELRNVIERALVISDGSSLELEHLPERVRAAEPGPVAAGLPQSATLPPIATSDADPVPQRVAAYEAALIRQALDDCDGNRTRAAAALGMPLRTFMRKLKKHGF